MSAIKDAFNAWWDGIARQGDPIRRPRLTEEAFEAGYRAAASDMLTTRDQFAARAMQTLINGPAAQNICDRDPRYDERNFAEVVALNAYEFADAMLKARRA